MPQQPRSFDEELAAIRRNSRPATPVKSFDDELREIRSSLTKPAPVAPKAPEPARAPLTVSSRGTPSAAEKVNVRFGSRILEEPKKTAELPKRNKPQPADPSVVRGIGRELYRGVKRGLGTAVHDWGSGQKTIGFEEGGKQIEDFADRNLNKGSDGRVNSLGDIHSARDAVDYGASKVAEGIGSSAGYLAAGAGLAAAGASAPVAMAGTVAAIGLPMAAGMVRNELQQMGITDRATILQATLEYAPAIALLDVATEAHVVTGMVQSAVKRQFARGGFRAAAKTVGKEALHGMASEGITEGYQEGIQYAGPRVTAGKPVNARELGGRVAEATVAGALPGAVMGGGGAVISKGLEANADRKHRNAVADVYDEHNDSGAARGWLDHATSGGSFALETDGRVVALRDKLKEAKATGDLGTQTRVAAELAQMGKGEASPQTEIPQAPSKLAADEEEADAERRFQKTVEEQRRKGYPDPTPEAQQEHGRAAWDVSHEETAIELLNALHTRRVLKDAIDKGINAESGKPLNEQTAAKKKQKMREEMDAAREAYENTLGAYVDRFGSEGLDQFLKRHDLPEKVDGRMPSDEHSKELMDMQGVGVESELVVDPTPSAEEEEGERIEANAPTGPDFAVSEVPTHEVNADPERFQFKQEIDPETGATKALSDARRYNADLAGVLTVWRDPANGKLYVVNGHHRLALAKRAQHPTVLVRRIKAQEAATARTVGAMQNIAEDKGTPTDVAKFLRDSGLSIDDLRDQGVSLRGRLAQRGLSLSNLDASLFQDVTTGRLSEDVGVGIGSVTDDVSIQREAAKVIRASDKRLSEAEAANVARQVLAAGSEEVSQETLFGTETDAKPLYVERARLSEAIKKALAADKRLFGFVTRGNRAEQLAKGGTSVDTQRAGEIAEKSAQMLELFDRLSTRAGTIASAITQGARAIAHGERTETVAKRIYGEVAAELSALTGAKGERAAGRETSDRGVEGEGVGAGGEYGGLDQPAGDSHDPDQNAIFERGADYSPSEYPAPTEQQSNVREQLELTFGSVEESQKAVQELIEVSGDYVTFLDVGNRHLTVEERRRNIKRSDSLAHAWIDVRGKKVTTPQDFFRLLHPFRSPRYEKIHVVYVDDRGTVVAHHAHTAGAINYVDLGKTTQWIDDIAHTAERLGVTKVFLAHNHPSGDPTPSGDDQAFFGYIGHELQKSGIYQVGHLVMDHHRANWIHMGQTSFGVERSVVEVNLPTTARDWTQAPGDWIRGPHEISAAVQAFPLFDEKAAHIVYLNSQNQVIAVEVSTREHLLKITRWGANRVKALAARSIAIVVPSEEVRRDVLREMNKDVFGVKVLDVIFNGTAADPRQIPTEATEDMKPSRRLRETGTDYVGNDKHGRSNERRSADISETGARSDRNGAGAAAALSSHAPGAGYAAPEEVTAAIVREASEKGLSFDEIVARQKARLYEQLARTNGKDARQAIIAQIAQLARAVDPSSAISSAEMAKRAKQGETREAIIDITGHAPETSTDRAQSDIFGGTAAPDPQTKSLYKAIENEQGTLFESGAPYNAEPERIVTAAIEIGNEVFTGAIHILAAQKAVEAGALEAREAADFGDWLEAGAIDGFITSTGRFVNRGEAYAIARKADQIDQGDIRGEEENDNGKYYDDDSDELDAGSLPEGRKALQEKANKELAAKALPTIDEQLAEIRGSVKEGSPKYNADGIREDVAGDPIASDDYLEDAGAPSGYESPALKVAASANASALAKAVGAPAPSPEIKALIEIARDLAGDVGVPFRKGRFNAAARKAAGVFFPHAETIRAQKWGDVPTVSHEVGHYVSKKVLRNPTMKGAKSRGAVALPRSAVKELVQMGKNLYGNRKPSGGYGEEGVAEAFKFYVADPARLAQEAPTFLPILERVLNEEPIIKRALLQARADLEMHKTAPDETRILAQLSVGKQPKVWASIDTIIAQVVDDLHAFRVANQSLGGSPIQQNAYVLARLTRGDAGLAEEMNERGVIDFFTRERVTSGIVPVLKSIKKKDMNSFRAYLMAQRHLELLDRGIQSGIDTTKQEAEAVVASGDAKFLKAAEALWAHSDALLKYRRDAGLLTNTEYQSIIQNNKRRVPFYREFDEEKDGRAGGGFGRKWGRNSSGIKAIRGSDRKIIDVIESVLKDTYTTVEQSNRHWAATTLIKQALATEGGGSIAEIVETPKVKTSVQLEKVAMQLIDLGVVDATKVMKNMGGGLSVEVDGKMVDLAGELYQFDQRSFASGGDAKDLVMPVIINGKRVWVQIQDPDLMNALEGMNANRTQFKSAVEWALVKPARVLRAGATLTGEFILRNPIRDFWGASIYTRSSRIRDAVPGAMFARGFYEAVFAKRTGESVYERWRLSGGDNAAMLALDRKQLQNHLQHVTRDWVSKTADIVIHPIDFLRLASAATENATRVGEFYGVEQSELRKGATPRDAEMVGAIGSRDVTVDFGMAGLSGRAINQIVAFFNATLQGTVKLGVELKRRPQVIVPRALISISLPSILLYLSQKDDEEYKKVPRWQKAVFWIWIQRDAKGNLKHIWRIPKPFELGIIFGTGAEAIAEFALEHDPKMVEEWLRSVRDNLLPPILPTSLMPVIEAVTDHSLFTGRSIVPASAQRNEPSQQSRIQTGETARQIGEAVNYSPAKIEHIVRGYTGGLGGYAMDIADVAVRKGRELAGKDPIKPQDPTAEDQLTKIPGVKGFTVNPSGWNSQAIEDFYTAFNNAETKRQGYKERIENNRPNDARDYYTKHKAEIDRVKTSTEKGGAGDLRKGYNEIAKLRKERTDILRSRLLPDEKTKRIKVLNDKANAIADRIMQ